MLCTAAEAQLLRYATSPLWAPPTNRITRRSLAETYQRVDGIGPILSPHCTQGAQGQAVRSNIRGYHKEASCQHQPGPRHSVSLVCWREREGQDGEVCLEWTRPSLTHAWRKSSTRQAFFSSCSQGHRSWGGNIGVKAEESGRVES